MGGGRREKPEQGVISAVRLTSPAYPCGYPCGYVAATGQSSGGATRYVAATGWLCARVGGARSWRARSGEVSLSNIVMSCQVYLHFHLIGEQKFGLHDDSSKKMASLSVKRSRMQFANIPSSSPYQWKPSLPDSEPSNASTTFGMFSVSLMPTQLILVF